MSRQAKRKKELWILGVTPAGNSIARSLFQPWIASEMRLGMSPMGSIVSELRNGRATSGGRIKRVVPRSLCQAVQRSIRTEAGVVRTSRVVVLPTKNSRS